jgi:hypothetical protein
MSTTPTTRRHFLKTLSAAMAAATAAGALPTAALAQGGASRAPIKLRTPIKLGFDNFAVRDMGWKAPQLIDYGARLGIDSLFITDLGPFERTDEAYLAGLRKLAADKGLEIQIGSWSICPTSKTWRKDPRWETAQEHLALGIRMAKALGSPVFVSSSATTKIAGARAASMPVSPIPSKCSGASALWPSILE